jgi:hypothetical protein
MAKTSPPRQQAAPPASVAEGAALVRGFTVKLYDRQNGESVDKRVIAETLFRAAFDVLDTLPDDLRQAIARRVHAGSYERTSDQIKAGSPTKAQTAAGPSDGAALHAVAPRPSH